MTKSRICHPPKMPVQNFGEFMGGRLWTLPVLGGGKFYTLSFQKVANSLHSGTLGGGKNSGTPCKTKLGFTLYRHVH